MENVHVTNVSHNAGGMPPGGYGPPPGGGGYGPPPGGGGYGPPPGGGGYGAPPPPPGGGYGGPPGGGYGAPPGFGGPPQGGYGAPPGGYGGPPQGGGQKTSGLAIASMVMGILSIPLCFCQLLSGPLAVLAVIMAGISLASMSKDPLVGGKGMAIAGLVTGILSLSLTVLALVTTLDEDFQHRLSPSSASGPKHR